ncbi:hypothetical protein [Bacterioplanoides sp. SCSIO 12839]|uniref:hypothetical protein n=1 Tax=Bacterioplanoides sp. SCSIO 12839 TaxID=2829569 RepID=UPI0021077E7E|nr:hypothetical protein [Bacterioplanoides sp. SCSIO 12839]UTW46767.1 hypothetical protein KFF03_09080 [Bacterioplanoides sp. SCSIO 12839]
MTEQMQNRIKGMAEDTLSKDEFAWRISQLEDWQKEEFLIKLRELLDKHSHITH